MIKMDNINRNTMPDEYITLREALQRFPRASAFKFVNVYGIISRYNYKENILNLQDENISNFEISINNKTKTFFDDNLKDSTTNENILNFKIGDIIRIQKLAMCHDFTIRCIRIDKCSIFDLTTEEDNQYDIGTTEHLNKEFERERIIQLKRVQADKLRNNQISQINFALFCSEVIDVAFELLHMVVNDNSLILVGWNGNCPMQRSVNLVSFEELAYTVSHRPFSDIVLDESILLHLYETEQLINIIVYNNYHEITETIRPFDYVICLKTFFKSDRIEYDRFVFTANISLKSPSCIRTISKKSLIGLDITNQLREFIKKHASYLIDDPENVQLNTTAINNQLEALNRQLQFIKNCNHPGNNDEIKEFVVKFFQNKHNIPTYNDERFFRIEDLSQLEKNDFPYKFVIRAKFVSFVNNIPTVSGAIPRTVFDNMNELRRFGTFIQCKYCDFQCSFLELEKQDIDADSSDFECPHCNTRAECDLLVSLKILIEDSSKNKYFIHFFGKRANKLFNIESVTEFYNDDSVIPSNLDILFKFLTHVSKDGSCYCDIDWKLSRIKNPYNDFFQIHDFDLIIE